MSKKKTKTKQSSAKKNKSMDFVEATEPVEILSEQKRELVKSSRITLIQAVDLVIELNGEDYFDKLLLDIKKGKYIGSYDKFMEVYTKYDNHHNDVGELKLRAIFALLIYIDSKSLPIYGSLFNERIHLQSMYLLSPLSWRKDFQELLTIYTTYQRITVDTSDITYLF